MAKSSVALAAVVLAGLVSFTKADAFLAQPRLVATEDVQQALISELSGLADVVQLHGIEKTLGSMFAALPKGEHGKLEPPTVRYALHRYFVQKHGWFVKGLEPATSEWNAASQVGIVKDRVPSYILSLFERSHAEGLGLHELAVFAATLTDLVHKEAVDSLGSMFDALQVPRTGPVTREASDLAVKAYLVTHLLGSGDVGNNETEVKALEKYLMEVYPSWSDTALWAADLRQTHEHALQHRSNPFVRHDVSTFDSSAAFVQEFGHRFGPFQNMECITLKGRLLDMEHQGSGRVRLSRFYKGDGDPFWPFLENKDYLRHLGALDETDPRHPSVMIANYVNAPSNCLTTSSFYSVCCLNECEGLLGHVEREIAAPSALPTRITEVISHLQSETVEAPRNLSVSLLSRLDEIAEFHGGHVPLHGRLFAQWMHHAYPRECPFPHVAGSTTALTPDEWTAATGNAYVASASQIFAHVFSPHANEVLSADGEATAFPWTNEEELVTRRMWTAKAKQTPWILAWVRIAMCFAALASVAMVLLRFVGAAKSPTKECKIEKYLV